MKTSFISSNRKYERLYKLESRKGFNNHNSKYENHKIKIDTFDYIKINQNSGGKTHIHTYISKRQMIKWQKLLSEKRVISMKTPSF